MSVSAPSLELVATPLTPKAETREPSPRFLFSIRQLGTKPESVSYPATYMNPAEASMAMERAWSTREPGLVEVATPLTPKAETREPSPGFLFSMRQLLPTSESVSYPATYMNPAEASMAMELAWSSREPGPVDVATPLTPKPETREPSPRFLFSMRQLNTEP